MKSNTFKDKNGDRQDTLLEKKKIDGLKEAQSGNQADARYWAIRSTGESGTESVMREEHSVCSDTRRRDTATVEVVGFFPI
ncbi:hypothetical protein PoB_006699800 [Plakobranchus ocellatus]|uniref:Uncharacterized protein n=1 Tax=Plakobranchus ocellatus TaxID=259542 RepID=A0AAV4D8W5_9GAST|nr:hypothetical protein PoB_006699800 [Plakobranchus ocellatus]